MHVYSKLMSKFVNEYAVTFAAENTSVPSSGVIESIKVVTLVTVS